MSKKIITVWVALLMVTACGGGSSESGAMVTPTLPGTNVPSTFAGTYSGSLTVTASALGITETDTFPITITVTDDAMVRFDGDEPEETFTVGLTDDGRFSGNLPIDVDECTGDLATTGRVDGRSVTGEVVGEGRCDISGLSVDVELSGSFTASK